MRTFLTLIVATVLMVSCQNKQEAGVPVLNLASLAAIPLDNPIDTLAKGKAFIEVKLPPGARIEELSKEDLGLLKAAAYRFLDKLNWSTINISQISKKEKKLRFRMLWLQLI
ncbi:hypothetical protein [Sphingobacterium sp. IITKGP-BTPF85]|uniref:hypothetical protein n=1 Tax=Sphingobacterium sp. IITKGP-BTPF85 TaxID=1338009 RepID=UPI000389E786|nr:hypothetical protein [Sphingobacterium sp. IITKGP-BTPF85]KKX47023.1 hypothetical protein L950_0228740 [Sphingobacterium sp. IITKGP-BTPF85]